MDLGERSLRYDAYGRLVSVDTTSGSTQMMWNDGVAAAHRRGCATASQLQSGVYMLQRVGSDVPFYIGRTRNFRSREIAHQARFGDDVRLIPLARTGNYRTMRGLEEFFIDAWLGYLGELTNAIGGVGAKNRNRHGYYRAAQDFLRRCGTPR